jgi:hypothetical protein
MSIDYKRIMEDSILKLSESLKQRRKLDNEIARLQKMVRWAALQGSAGRVPEGEINKDDQGTAFGLTEAISRVLRTYDTWLSPVLVRDLLHSVGFDIGAYREPLPSIHVTLKRLVDGGEAIQSKVSSGKTVYMWTNGHRDGLQRLATSNAPADVQCEPVARISN